MDNEAKEKQELTEELIKTKYKCYQHYLRILDEEFLAYEFNDRMGCDPVCYYTNAMNWDKENVWISTLEDNMANLLYDDPMMDPINREYWDQCK
jgi:hypothetical protein